MKQSRVVSVAVAVTASFGLLLTAAPAAFAQDQTDASSASAPTQKQLDKAKKKAARKAARARHASDLKAIGTGSGYRLTNDQSNYPQNAVQKPPAKAAPAAPASGQ
ncbi:hypothetical protein [Burkholderia pseudomultivorans]|uniref:Purine nucleoside phosphorylase n=1 Tax=Burkholderia pseudomultivorans TaxID=1207504 RepID=A0A132EJA6_9BURK|nr:hypothetical protein [Burkholderia pseudomultivorans]KWF30864.1 hypothetical protein WT56_12705 [Burkholderia pseudomultivorans]MDR8732293.1 hypothetical protein [Burkholderia pseudomultivorans]MDR8736957.1 hypothetical protein [Burkholderia pseudomultivorans]MDR8743148.1 hypothetical protein [Burkholderia pseudomultivorans]MDR8754523.1 hypothetical protein [Burkholderia pseudomultivorans]